MESDAVHVEVITMKRFFALLLMATGLAFGQGQVYNPLGLDLSGYWSQFAHLLM